MNNLLPSLFAFAGRAFLGAPQAELLATLRELPQAQGGEAGSWRATLEEVESTLSGDELELHREYVRLFLDPMGAPCPPWQSVHSPEARLMGESHDSAKAWFRQGGVEPRLENEPADHIGLLLAFCSQLLREPASRDLLEKYYEDHLAWAVAYCNNLCRESQHKFYSSLASLTNKILDETSHIAHPAG